MAQFNIGDKVVQVLPLPILGEVVDYGLDRQAGKVLVLVAYTDAAGERHTKHFMPGELAAVPETAA